MFSFLPHSRRTIQVSLSALLAVLTLSSCFSGPHPHTADISPFTSDGCSLFPDGTFTDRYKWCDCCQTHDLAYWQGGSADERSRADVTLRDCVLTRTGDKELAETMYLGVQVVGSPAFPTWYRWGYGWSYGRGYQPLSKVEIRHVKKWLADYTQRHPAGYCVEKNSKP